MEQQEQQHKGEVPAEGAVERRFFAAETRAGDGEERVIEGYAAVYNSYTSMGWYIEVIEPGFFDDMDTSEAACLFNHDENQVLGRAKNKTLTMKSDKKGLKYVSKVPDTTQGRDVYNLVKDGYVDQSSFGFTVAAETWEYVDRNLFTGKLSEAELDRAMYGGQVKVRHLEKGRKLYDVSPVTFPAYKDTSVAKRRFEDWTGRAQQKEATAVDAVAEKNRLRGLLALSE